MSYEYADGYKIRNQDALYFLTLTVVGWVDLFSRKIYRDEFLKNIEVCRKNKHLSIGAYVIMTNHVHLICRSEDGRLSDTLRDLKSYCTKQFIQLIQQEGESRRDWLLHLFAFHAHRTHQNKDYKIWTGDNHPEEIHSQEFMLKKLNYIHQNPVRAGWVNKAEDYLYSSAKAYAGEKGVIEVDYLF